MVKKKAEATAGEGHNSTAEMLDAIRGAVADLEAMEADLNAINVDKKERYAQAKAMGLEPGVIRQVLAIRRKDPEKRLERNAKVDFYLEALGMDPLGSAD